MMSATSLYDNFFQFGYVARNLDKAIPAFTGRFGPAEFLIVPVPAETNGVASGMFRLALSYINDVMIEVIEVDPSKSSIYLNALPADETEIRLHHLGYLIDDHCATIERLSKAGFEVPVAGSSGDVLDYAYADTRQQLGHYSEYIRLGAAGKAFFGSVPRN